MKLYILLNRRTLNIYHLFVFGVRVVCASRDLPVIRCNSNDEKSFILS